MMATIYETRGKAREYCELATNLYRGCGHGCVYCYAPNATYSDRDTFCQASPRPGILEKLGKDAAKLGSFGVKPESPILLSFTTDPYQPIDCEYKLTRQAIEILHFYGLKVQILTKGGRRAERDFDLLREGDSFGVTLTLLDNAESLKWEPHAGLPGERIESLQNAHKLGIKTWVSLEPVIDPNATLEIIRQTHEFVDLYKVGVMNYHPVALTVNWYKFARDVVKLLNDLDCEYYLKKDLVKYLV
jgi:DNA repair photolyase